MPSGIKNVEGIKEEAVDKDISDVREFIMMVLGKF